ncbi:conserved hypothetical protein [Ricinus communis]|uniref:Uncharacterized protein n=1 Tax=Ricinus communis TaxID=3988 RepID=B9TIY1_RICCO|nr:conserved hypothetical protein [Ricinus communis]
MVDVDRGAVARDRQRYVIVHVAGKDHVTPLAVRIRQGDGGTVVVHQRRAIGAHADAVVSRAIAVAIHGDLGAFRRRGGPDKGRGTVVHDSGPAVQRPVAVLRLAVRIGGRFHQVLASFGFCRLRNADPEIAAAVPAVPAIPDAVGVEPGEIGRALRDVDATAILVVIERLPVVQSGPAAICPRHGFINNGRVAGFVGMRSGRDPWDLQARHVGAKQFGGVEDAVIQEFIGADRIGLGGRRTGHGVDLGALCHHQPRQDAGIGDVAAAMRLVAAHFDVLHRGRHVFAGQVVFRHEAE